MSQKRHMPEQIINKLRQAEVELSRGATVVQATELIERLGGREYAEQRARHHADQAQAALTKLRESPARDALSRLADYAVERHR